MILNNLSVSPFLAMGSYRAVVKEFKYEHFPILKEAYTCLNV